MTDVKGKKSTRRAFFLNGGAMLGAGVASTVGAAALRPEPVQQPGHAEDREAIRRLHLALMARLENQGDIGAATLFDEQGIVQLGAYRQTPSQDPDEVQFSADGQRASATFHGEVELCTPLQGDCTAAQMARLQGQTDSRRWERGRFEGRYVKRLGEWQMEALSYSAS